MDTEDLRKLLKGTLIVIEARGQALLSGRAGGAPPFIAKAPVGRVPLPKGLNVEVLSQWRTRRDSRERPALLKKDT